MLTTAHRLLPTTFPALRRDRLETLQVNLGYRCNQSCVHCHVAAGPQRPEQMDEETVGLVLEFLRSQPVQRLDLTGGAPELNPYFRYLVAQATDAGLRVVDRCNLTILSEPGQEDLAAFLAAHRVEVVASLPCYLEENVDRQRGNGVFQDSIQGLRRLNGLGYGGEAGGRVLNLVYNPQGPVLPPEQSALERDYRERMAAYGVQFNRLLTIANMPIQRFGSTLQSKGQFDGYLQLLRKSHRPANLSTVMCRTLLSVDWQGYLYDCDFNQMLGMGLASSGNTRIHIRDALAQDHAGAEIRVAEHCYGCTAGQGSGCGGALS